MNPPYFWLGWEADNDPDLLMAYEFHRLLQEGEMNFLPDYVEVTIEDELG